MLSKKLSTEFDSGVIARGRDYFESGRVQLFDSPEPNAVTAVVTGSNDYTVEVHVAPRRRSWTVLVGCTCPRYCNEAEFCKHIWAALLAVDQKNAWNRLGPLPDTVRLGMIDLDDDALDDGPDEDPLSTLAHFSRVSFGDRSIAQLQARAMQYGSRPWGQRQARSPNRPAWTELLSRASLMTPTPHASASLSSGPLEPMYIIETQASDESNALVLELAERRITRSGRMGKPKRLTISAEDVTRLRDVRDRMIFLMLVGAGSPHYEWHGWSHRTHRAAHQWQVAPQLHGEILPLLFDTGRVYYRTLPAADPLPLTRDDGEPWQLVLAVRSNSHANKYAISPEFRRRDQRLCFGEPTCIFGGEPSFMIHGGGLAKLEAHGCYPWIDMFRQRDSFPVTRKDIPTILDRLSELGTFPPFEWPDDWGITEVGDACPHPELDLRLAPPDRRKATVEAGVVFRYGETNVDGLRPSACAVDAKNRRVIRRHAEQESRLLDRLINLGLRRPQWSNCLETSAASVPALVRTLLDEGWTVRGNRALYKQPGEFKIEATSGIDWFDLNGHVDFGGQRVALPELLAALRKGQAYVTLDDGSLGLLPEKWLKQHGALLEMGTVADGAMRFARTQVLILDALLAQMPQASFDDGLARARKRLKEFSGVAPRPEPAGFTGTLRPYQREGLGWLHFLRDFGWGGCLADDMGLGKTIQMLALLADGECRDESPSLAVVPKSLVFNWQREAHRFAPRLRVLDYTGLSRKTIAPDFSNYDLVLTTYGTLRRDITFLCERQFNYVLLDEAQAIKNPNSQCAKAVRLLRSRHRLVLTGTPVENSLGDLWSILEFLNPGMLGALPAFKAAFVGNNGHIPDPQCLGRLQGILRPFILRRTKEQVAADLPPRSEQTIECEMGPKQSECYRDLREYYRSSLLARVQKVGLARAKIHVLEALLRLRQCACHPALIDRKKKNIDSAKLDALWPMLDELIAEGHKALIFSQFTTMLALVRESLDRRGVVYEYLDGRTQDRQARVDRFQSDERCPLFLISLKAGGVGLNLTAADYVFILDPWWNPAVEAQAIDRTHRIGQTKRVIAYRLITKDTVESKIIELQKSKRALAEAIVTESNSLIRNLTRDDLALLLS